MDLVSKLIAVVTLLLTLSVASERLVEIIKGFFPGRFTEVPPVEEMPDEKIREQAERRRKAEIAILSVVCGIITALLASPIILTMFRDLYGSSACQSIVDFSGSLGSISCMSITTNGLILTLAMGLLASGGSALWNSVLEYLLKIKDVKKLDVERTRVSLAITKREFFDQSSRQAAARRNAFGEGIQEGTTTDASGQRLQDKTDESSKE